MNRQKIAVTAIALILTLCNFLYLCYMGHFFLDHKKVFLCYYASKTCSQTLPRLHAFFISSTFISNARMKLAKNQANAKHQHEAELLLFESYSHSSSTLSSKIIGQILKNKQKNKCVCIHEIIRLIIMKMKMKMKNRSYIYDINRPTPIHGEGNIVNIKCLSMTMFICIKQHLNNI